MSQKTRSRRDDRAEVILDAAGAVLRRGGARALTIDAVATEAGLSKGGVLHHYASKDALILALVGRKLEELRTGIAACEAERGPGATGLALGMIEHLRRSYCEEDEFSRALLLASAENPDPPRRLPGVRGRAARPVRGCGGAGRCRGRPVLLAARRRNGPHPRLPRSERRADRTASGRAGTRGAGTGLSRLGEKGPGLSRAVRLPRRCNACDETGSFGRSALLREEALTICKRAPAPVMRSGRISTINDPSGAVRRWPDFGCPLRAA